MKAFASLHTAAPNSQIDHEVSYAGYRRLEVDFDDQFGEVVLNLMFPVINEDSDDVITYIAIGRAEYGQGEILMRIPAIPNIPVRAEKERLTRKFWLDSGVKEEDVERCIESYGQVAPKIAVCNSNPIKLPDNLNPIARVAHQLIYSGLMTIEELHPKLYEAINDALHNAGVPVLKVTRGSAAAFKGKMSELPSLQQWGPGHA